MKFRWWAVVAFAISFIDIWAALGILWIWFCIKVLLLTLRLIDWLFDKNGG